MALQVRLPARCARRIKRLRLVESTEMKSQWLRWTASDVGARRLLSGGPAGCQSNREQDSRDHVSGVHVISPSYVPARPAPGPSANHDRTPESVRLVLCGDRAAYSSSRVC